MSEALEDRHRLLAESVKIDGVAAHATLSGDAELRWTEAAGRDRRLVVESEVLGVEAGRRRILIKALVKGGSGFLGCGGEAREKGSRVRRDYVLEMPSEEAAEAWATRIRRSLDSLGRPKNLYIFLNPFGGRKCARTIFDNEVKPLLDAAGVCYVLQETQHQLHAQEVAYTLDLTKYDGIICVSGDGILGEVLNGLLLRNDWQSAIKVPLGIIPAGTGNALVKSLLDAAGEICSVTNAVLAIIRGHRRDLDVATISQGEKRVFSALMMCWGLVADVDIESEKFRWMGSARFEAYLLSRIINLRRYHGSLSFVPGPGYETCGETDKHYDKELMNDDIVLSQQYGYQGPKNSFKSMEWRCIEGPFVSVVLHNVPWLNRDVLSAPEAKFSDGHYDLVIINDCPRMVLLRLLLGMTDGSHVKSPYVKYIKVKAFRLVPGQRVGKPMEGGIIDSDGEVLARGSGTYLCNQHLDPMKYGLPIELQVDKGLATIFCPV